MQRCARSISAATAFASGTVPRHAQERGIARAASHARHEVVGLLRTGQPVEDRRHADQRAVERRHRRGFLDVDEQVRTCGSVPPPRRATSVALHRVGRIARRDLAFRDDVRGGRTEHLREQRGDGGLHERQGFSHALARGRGRLSHGQSPSRLTRSGPWRGGRTPCLGPLNVPFKNYDVNIIIERFTCMAPPKKDTEALTLRLPREMIEAIDDRRRFEKDLPTRPEMIRRALTQWSGDDGRAAGLTILPEPFGLQKGLAKTLDLRRALILAVRCSRRRDTAVGPSDCWTALREGKMTSVPRRMAQVRIMVGAGPARIADRSGTARFREALGRTRSSQPSDDALRRLHLRKCSVRPGKDAHARQDARSASGRRRSSRSPSHEAVFPYAP